MKDEIKIVTIGDIFENLQTQEKAMKFLCYIKHLQKELEKHKKLDDYLKIMIDRNNKAIEYIEEHIKYECDGTYSGMSFYSHHLYDNFKKEDLLNILQGSDKNE